MDLLSISSKLLGSGLEFLGKKVLGDKGMGTVNKISKFLGVSPDELEEKLDPDTLIKLKELELQEFNMQVQDKENARGREIAITQATGKRDINLYLLAWTIIIGFFFLMGILIFKDIPIKNLSILNMVIGALLGSFTTVVGYFFGSSKSSSDKTKMLGGIK